MFWDICAISCLSDYPDEKQLVSACFEVLADTLSLDHLACQEAAIHGYGEFQFSYPDHVADAIDAYLKTEITDPRLRTYAMNARDGHIQ